MMTDETILYLALGAAVLLLGYGLAAWALLARRRRLRRAVEMAAWLARLEGHMRDAERSGSRHR